MWSNLVFGIVLIGVSLLMSWFQYRAAQKLKRDRKSLDADEAKYLQARYRRHAITNALIGLTGVAIIASSSVQTTEATLVYWGFVMVLVAAIVYSALMDVSATRRYFGELRREQLRERQALTDELKRFQDEQDAADDTGQTE